MAKGKPSETEAQVLPSEGQVTPETALPEQVEAVPETGVLEVPVQEKPDFRAQFDELPEEDRKVFLEERAAELVRRAEQSGEGKAYARLQADQLRQAQANLELQDTLRNLDSADDDNKRGGHILAFAQRQAQEQANRQSLANLESVREALGVSPDEHTELIFKLHQKAAREGQIATFGDYVTAVTGERFMPKRESDAKIRAEVNAAMEERLGKEREAEPHPVSVGQGQPASGSTDKIRKEYADGEIDYKVYEQQMKARGAKP